MSDESKDQGEPSNFSSSFLGQIKDKLILSKEKTAAQGRHLTGMPDAARLDRLPPGQHRVDKWPVLDLGVQPDVPKAQWRLTERWRTRFSGTGKPLWRSRKKVLSVIFTVSRPGAGMTTGGRGSRHRMFLIW